MQEQDPVKKYDINSSDDEGDEKAQSQISSKHKSRMIGYDEILDLNVIKPRTKEQMIAQLKKSKIIYNELRSLQAATPYAMQVSKINHTKNYEIVTLTISIGPFEQDVTILNVFEQSFAQKMSLEPLFYQGHTNIYYFTYKQNECICKSTSFSGNEKNQQMQVESRKQEILQGLKEFCITNIMSALKIGPKVSNSFFFDMVVSESGVQLYLQHCIPYIQKGFTQNDAITLKTHLKEMHILGILHRDIKPSNMMYSKSFEKYVFIDFGISDFKSEKPGELIRSKYLGTYAYCTEEFKKLFKSRQIGLVDAHINDVWGLNLSIKQMRMASDSERIPAESLANACIQIIEHPDLLERQVKRMIYSNEIHKISTIVNMKQADPNFQRKILNFFYEVPTTESLRKFYLIEISDEIKKEKIFQQLWDCFKTPVFIESYKGTRIFLTLGEQKSYKNFSKIYSKIKDKYQNLSKDDKIYNREVGNFLLDYVNDKAYKQTLKEHQKLLVYWISFTNLKEQPSLLQKKRACENYAIRVGLSLPTLPNLQDNNFLMRKLFEDVLSHVSQSILRDSSLEDWNFVLKLIENYFILLNQDQFNLKEYLGSFIERVRSDRNVSNLFKVQIMFRLLFMRRIPIRRYKYALQFTETSVLELRVQQIITQIIDQEQNKGRNSDTKVLQFLLKTVKLFKNQSSGQCQFDDSEQFVNDIKILRPSYPEIQKIFYMIEFEVGIQLEKNDFVTQGRKLQEESTYHLVIQSGQLSFYYLQMINIYDESVQIKKIKTYLALLDQAINFQEISDQYFIRIRITVENYLNNEVRTKQLMKKLQLMTYRNMNVLYCLNTYRWILRMYYLSLLCLVKLIPQFDVFRKNIQSQLERQKNKQMKLQKPLMYRFSKNWLKLQLLHFCRRIEIINRSKSVMSNNIEISLLNYSNRINPQHISQTAIWEELSTIDRTEFTPIDHVFMMQFDIEKLKVQKNDKALLQYIKDRLSLINKIAMIGNKHQKRKLIRSFSRIAGLLNYYGDPNLLKEFIKIFIDLIKKPYFGTLYLIENSRYYLTNSIIMTNNFDFLMGCLIQSTKIHSRQLSNSNIPLICRYYSTIASSVLFYYKDAQMVAEIKKVFSSISPKQHSIFSIFLLFFIYPCNRKKIISFVLKCLDYLNLTGKYIILTRLYKEVLKIQKIPSRKRFLMRKDIIYPSRYNFNLYDMKQRLNSTGDIYNFKGIFLQVFEQKILKLGRNCEVYNELRTQNQSKNIFDQIELDYSSKEFRYQKWEQQNW